jgi:hypothetical protein
VYSLICFLLAPSGVLFSQLLTELKNLAAIAVVVVIVVVVVAVAAVALNIEALIDSVPFRCKTCSQAPGGLYVSTRIFLTEAYFFQKIAFFIKILNFLIQA